MKEKLETHKLSSILDAKILTNAIPKSNFELYQVYFIDETGHMLHKDKLEMLARF